MEVKKEVVDVTGGKQVDVQQRLDSNNSSEEEDNGEIYYDEDLEETRVVVTGPPGLEQQQQPQLQQPQLQQPQLQQQQQPVSGRIGQPQLQPVGGRGRGRRQVTGFARRRPGPPSTQPPAALAGRAGLGGQQLPQNQQAQLLQQLPPQQQQQALQQQQLQGAGRGQAGFGQRPQNQGIQGPGGRFRGELFVPRVDVMPTTLEDLFKNIPLETIMIENWVLKRLVLIGHLQPLDKALQRLNRHKITSLPVINETNGKIMGILDALDVVNYLSTVLDQEPIGPARWDFNLETTGTLLTLSKKKAMVISNQATMYDGLLQLTRGVKRLMVIDAPCKLHLQEEEEEGILGLFTQSDVIRFLGQNPYWLNRFPKSQKSLKELGIIDGAVESVVTVEQNTIASLGFKTIAETNASGVAVVDQQRRIVATLSASNIRGISRRNFQLLRRPLYEFLQRDRRRGWWNMPICATEEDTLEKTILQFCSTKVHQVFVVDSIGRPVVVVTLTDVLKALITDTEPSSTELEPELVEKMKTTNIQDVVQPAQTQMEPPPQPVPQSQATK